MIRVTKIRDRFVHWLDEQNYPRRSTVGTITTHAQKHPGKRWESTYNAMMEFFKQFKQGETVVYKGELHIVNCPAHPTRYGSLPLKTTRLSDGKSFAIVDWETCTKTDGIFFASKSVLWELVRLAIHDNTVAISKLGELLGSN